MNAICWSRILEGNYSEIIERIEINDNVTTVDVEYLNQLKLSKDGQIARNTIINDFKLLREYGTDPSINVIRKYERDEEFQVFPTDVYSYHIDRATIAADTFLCTYYGDSSDILPNHQAIQKICIPEIRSKLLNKYGGLIENFEHYLRDHFYDLHYQAKANFTPVSLGVGNMWRLAIDYPGSMTPPCIHRAPKEISGRARLMMIS